MITPVILCGGSGTRLWPLSRSSHPKQLLPLVTERTMLQDTILRVQQVTDVEPMVICNEQHRFLVAEQLQEIQLQHPDIILEPAAKNTAPAVTIAALHFLSQEQDPLMLVLPADHVIKKPEAFKQAVISAEKLAMQGLLVTFGVTPTLAETGYGYIKRKAKHDFQVEKFVEKPDAITAQEYIKSGDYLWNSGMFLFRASVFLDEIAKHASDILAQCRKTIAKANQDFDFIRLPQQYFSECRSDSIDYAVMEKSERVAVVELDAEWNDVGSWDALWSTQSPDADGNVIQGDVYTTQVTGSYLHAETRMVAAVGVQDHVIVETADAVLVAHKDHSQQVKTIVEHLKNTRRSEIDLHRRVYRPWGYYEVLDGTAQFQVKRIMVKPSGRLSLQSHQYRSEHWVVISGVATVTCGEDRVDFHPNQSTYIPIGVKHRLENNGAEPLVIIEVQCGTYVGEDDIVRFEDVYGRKEREHE